jgi:hypothetical protein
MIDKAHMNSKTPDLTKMQEVIINPRTRIYIAIGASAKEAKERYLQRSVVKKV